MSEPGLLKFELVTEEPAVLVANTIYFVKNSTVNRIVISGNLPQDPLRVTSTTALENIASKMYIASGNTKEEARNSIDAAAINHTHTTAEVTGLDTALNTKVSLTGDQNISGVKVFTTAIEVTGTSKATGRFYAGTTEPDNTKRLNYDGKLHSSGFGAGRFMMEYNASSQSLDFNFV